MAFIDEDEDELDETLPPEGDDEHDEDDEDITGEARARVMGWKPQEEFDGPPSRWADWPEFLRRGEAELPILREQNRRLSNRLGRLEPEMKTMRERLAEQGQAIKDAMNLARTANDAGYKRALDELKQEQRAAVREGDEEAYDAVSEQIEAMEAERAKAAPVEEKEEAPTTPPGPSPAIAAFIEDNPWFNDETRPDLRLAMVAHHTAILRKHPNMPLADQLAAARDRLVQDFPEIDGDDDVADPEPRPARPARARTVMAPTNRPIPRQPAAGEQGSPFDRIDDPAERTAAREAFQRIKRNDPGITASEYMRLYDNPHLDALELRRQRKK